MTYPKAFIRRLAEFDYIPTVGQFPTKESQAAALAWLEELDRTNGCGGFTKNGGMLTMVVNKPGRTRTGTHEVRYA